MLEWQGIEFWIQKVKLHSCTAYKVVGAGLGGQDGYLLLYASQWIGSNGKAHPLLVLHWNRGITTAIYYPNNILVRLSTIRHKSLELRLRYTVLYHNIIEVLSKYIMSNYIFSLLIAHRNCHDSTRCGIIDVASHRRGKPLWSNA
jgi:hypothetical protein